MYKQWAKTVQAKERVWWDACDVIIENIQYNQVAESAEGSRRDRRQVIVRQRPVMFQYHTQNTNRKENSSRTKSAALSTARTFLSQCSQSNSKREH